MVVTAELTQASTRVAAACLPLFGHSEVGAIVCVMGFGLGFDLATIARPAILADRYGTTAYASIASILAVPLTIAKAFAPLAAAHRPRPRCTMAPAATPASPPVPQGCV